MKLLEHFISFILGIMLMVITVFCIESVSSGRIFLLSVLLFLVHFYGGKLIGIRFSKDNYLINSILFGMGPLISTMYFLFALGWINESAVAGYILIIFSAVTIFVSYKGAKSAIKRK